MKNLRPTPASKIPKNRDQPRKSPQNRGSRPRDDNARTALEALHAGVVEHFVERRLQQVHEVLQAVEAVLALHVLRVEEAEVRAVARGRAGPDHAAGQFRLLEEVFELHDEDERTQHLQAEIAGETEVCGARALHRDEVLAVLAGAAGAAEVGKAEGEEGFAHDVPVEMVDVDDAVVEVEHVQGFVVLQNALRRVHHVHRIGHVDGYDGNTRVGSQL